MGYVIDFKSKFLYYEALSNEGYVAALVVTVRLVQWKIPRDRESQLPHVLKRVEAEKTELGVLDVQVRLP